jgi:hypothetical protein
MSDTTYTPAEYEWARRVVISQTEDPDFLGVGEMLEDDWKGLDEKTRDEVHERVHDLACSAKVTVSWPHEPPPDERQSVEATPTIREELAEAAHLVAPLYDACGWGWVDQETRELRVPAAADIALELINRLSDLGPNGYIDSGRLAVSLEPGDGEGNHRSLRILLEIADIEIGPETGGEA